MNIKEIKKLNVEDGDIIFIPMLKMNVFKNLEKVLRRVFPGKQFILVSATQDIVDGIKVVHLKEEKK